MAPKVFVSHASEDKERFVLDFATKLRENGVDAWLDKGEMLPGDSLVEKLFEKGLKEAKAVIIVLSQYSVNKPWVKEELNTSVVNKISKGTKIIPVVLDKCEVPESLKSTLWENVNDTNNYQKSLDRIIASIFGQTNKPPNTKWDVINRWPLEEADELGKLAVLRSSADESARHVRGLYFTFLLFAFYVAVIVFSTTDEQLLKKTGARLPLLNVELDLLGFYIFIPWLVLLYHLHLLNQFYLLSQKLHNQNKAIARLPENVQRTHRAMPFPLIFSHMVIGTHYRGLLRFAFKAAVVVTVIIVPAGLLLSVQWMFLPYHSSLITLNHLIVLLLDILLLWLFWPRMAARSGRWIVLWPWSSRLTVLGEKLRFIPPRTKRQRYYMYGMLSLTVAVPIISIALIVLPGNNLYLREKTLMKNEPPPELIAAYKIAGEPPGKVWLDHGKPLDLQKRDLRNAIFSYVTFWDVDLREARLQGADLRYTKLQDANLQEAQLQGANLRAAQLQGANLQEARLQGAELQYAQLQGAELQYAQLQGANLGVAQLQGANLGGAQLQGADLRFAQLQGANLGGAQLQGADLQEAQLQDAKLGGAQLQGAELQYAQLQGADLQEAQLQGANLQEARLQGANLRAAQLQGASLRGTIVYATEFTKANLSMADFRGIVFAPIDSFKSMELLELKLARGAKSWPNDAQKRYQEALTHFLDIAFDPPLDSALPAPSQATDALYDQCGLFADWPSPLDVDAFETSRAEFLANLSCDDEHVAEAMVAMALSSMLPSSVLPIDKKPMLQHFFEKTSLMPLKLQSALAQALLDKAASKTCHKLAAVVEENRKKVQRIARQTKRIPATKSAGSPADATDP